MTARIDDLKSRLAKLQKEIEQERRGLKVVDDLTALAKDVGQALINSAKKHKLAAKHLDGKTFKSTRSNRGELTIELIDQTERGNITVVKTSTRSK